MYSWPQFSFCENQIASFEPGRYFQFTLPLPDSRKVSPFSSSTSRIAPVVASATRRLACWWLREVDTNDTCVLSGLHCTSTHSPPHFTSSHSVERCWSGPIWRRVTLAAATSMTTRSIMVMNSSPGSGYFQARSIGWPATVFTRYISPALRWSCWKVAIRFESGDHTSTGASLLVQPALSVA